MKHALIMAGGSGSRLWPLSREGSPKQLLTIASGRSLLEEAWTRIEGLIERRNRWVCAEESWRADVADVLPDLENERYLGEPEGRDTLAALAFSCAVIEREDPDAIVAVFTADHVIEPAESLRASIATGFRIVQRRPEVLLTFGITPTSPETAYGYLELGEAVGKEGARPVLCFREKPDREAAESFVAAGSGRFLWNSGMFLWKARTFLDHVRSLHPHMADGMERIAVAWGSPERASVVSDVYVGLPRISVDHGLMEPITRRSGACVLTIPLSLSWKDIGSWSSYAAILPHDEEGNARGADLTELIDCRGTAVVSTDPRHLVAVVGCEDLVIVHTPNATLVCRSDRAETIKQLQKRIAREYGSDFA
jgi:mannose-1-phosphate guanylyltransferase